MASKINPLNLTTIAITVIIFFLTISLPKPANSSIEPQELELMLSAMRSHNYNLFGNGMTASDILYDLQNPNTTSKGFTFFVPTDSHLFSLDMTSTARLYTQTLRYHIVPRRLSVSLLRQVPETGSWISTLLPRRDIHVFKRVSLGSEIFCVDGVEVAVPGLFYGRDVAVHGLAGILSFRSPILTVFPFTLPVKPRIEVNGSVFHPLPKIPMVIDLVPSSEPTFPPEIQNRFPPTHSPDIAHSTVNTLDSVASVNQAVTPTQMNDVLHAHIRHENKLLEISTDTEMLMKTGKFVSRKSKIETLGRQSEGGL